jgi:hypothetical protein
MKVSQIIRSDSQKTKEQLNKKINTEITEGFTPTKLTCPHNLQSKSVQLVRVESVRRTKTRIHRSSKKLDLKKSKVRREPLSTLTKFKHKSPDKTQEVRDIKIPWHLKRRIFK